MKKRHTKLRKFLIRTLLFTLLTIGMCSVLLRSKTVQTFIAKKATDWLSKEIGAKVSIGSIDFDFFRDIVIEDLLMEDQEGDTMIYGKSMLMQYKFLDRENRVFAFYSVSLKMSQIAIGYHKNKKDKNIDFLIDYINGPPKKDNTPKKLWSITFDKANIYNSRFRYFDEGEMNTEPGILDEYNLDFRDINGKISNLHIVDDSIHFFSENLSTRERSGLTIKRMNSDCNIHYLGMDFTSLNLDLACSKLKGELHFKYPGYKHLDEFVSNTQWNGKLHGSSVCLGELSIFDASFNNHPESLYVKSINVSGTYDHLLLSRVDVTAASGSHFTGSYYFEGLPDWRTTYCEFDIPYLKTSGKDISRLLNGLELPDIFNQAGEMTANGKFTGQFMDFKWTGLLNSDYGPLETDVLMNFKPGLENADFSGLISSESFDLGIIDPILGPSAFDVNISGKGFTKEHFKLNLSAEFSDYTLNQKTYADAKIDGDFTAKLFSGDAYFNDPLINSDFHGSVDYSGALPKFQFVANTKGIDLLELGLDSTRTLIWGESSVNLVGYKPDDMVGTVDFTNVSIHRLGAKYQFASQHLERIVRKNGTEIILDGDLLTGNINGKVSLENAQNVALNALASIFPERIPETKYIGKDSFVYDLTMHSTGLLFSYLNPEITTTTLHCSGEYFTGKDEGTFKVFPLDIEYKDYRFKGAELQLKKQHGIGLEYAASISQIQRKEEALFNAISLTGEANHGHAEYMFNLANRTNQDKIELLAESEIYADSITVQSRNSRLFLARETWDIDSTSSLTVYNSGKITCYKLYLNGKDHYVEAMGDISAEASDVLRVDFGNFGFQNIQPFLPESSLDSLSGVMNGTFYLSSLLGNPRFEGIVNARKLKFYGLEYGDLDLVVHEIEGSPRLGVDCEFIRGLFAGVRLNGSIDYSHPESKNQIKLLADIPKNTSLQFLQPFMVDIMTIKSGTVDGQLRIEGNAESPVISGNVAVRKSAFTIDYLNTTYYMDADFFSIPQGFFTSQPATLKDGLGGVAKFQMAIKHTNYKNYYLDLLIDSAVNLKALNTTQKDNDLYYGTGFADGSCRIYGPFDKISMDINLKSRAGSNIQLLYSDIEENSIASWVTFRNNKGMKTSVDPVKQNSALYRVNINLTATPDLKTEFVIDRKTGDIISGRGNGDLRMLYDENENFYLYGNYTVEEGDYVFSLPGINVLTRRIALQKGGTITWTGDPYNSNINMIGQFEKKLSPSALMTAVSAGAPRTYPAITIVSSLYMKGSLFSPEITFDIQAPELEKSAAGTSNDVLRVIQRIRADKDETMRQAVALLLFGNFITPSFAQSSGSNSSVISGSGVAGNSLSSIASNVVNDFFTRLGIKTQIQVNIDDVRNATGSSNTKVFINSETFLTERIRLDVNYDPTVAMLVSNVALPINFNLEYMTRNENWRIKAFSRSNNLLLQQNNSTLTTGVSGNTLGAGVVYRIEFENFKLKSSSKDSAAIKKAFPTSVKNPQRDTAVLP